MKFSEAFPSKYLKAVDLKSRKVKLVIDSIAQETLGEDDRVVFYFKGKPKGVIMNLTNCGLCAMAWGDDMEDWEGKELVLSSGPKNFKGKIVQGFNVDPVVPVQDETGGGDDEDPFGSPDEIPI